MRTDRRDRTYVVDFEFRLRSGQQMKIVDVLSPGLYIVEPVPHKPNSGWATVSADELDKLIISLPEED